jgi:hypothetical protein
MTYSTSPIAGRELLFAEPLMTLVILIRQTIILGCSLFTTSKGASMRDNTDRSRKETSNAMFRAFIFLVLCLILLVVVLSCSGCLPERSPPDLSSCNRIEIRYPNSTLDYFLPSTALQRSILSTKEKEYIQSIEFFTVNDPERIKAFSHDVSLGSYVRRRNVTYPCINPIEIHCYRNNERLISFTVLENDIITEDSHIFTYPRGLPDVKQIEPVEMQPFKLRFQCAWNMQNIYTAGPLYKGKVNSYPEPAEWCDAIMRNRTNTSYVSDERMMGHFKCPAGGEGKCHYAMNPDCEPNSPPDMVLLFETKAGWNQHGGPELFTFDNHDPKGGCVLLNDGTVKFIRTKEELQQLRWK